MNKLLQAISAGFMLALAVPASAQNTPVVVELYTSQGCSSCPPADELMDVLADREDVIALSLHVDYWDYIGWKDEFADPAHAKRQRAYATVAGRNSVYTPEMVINGVSDIVGAKPMAVATAIEKHKAEPKQVALQLVRRGQTVRIRAQTLAENIGPMVVQLIRYHPQRVARITRGENAGKTIAYTNVAQDWLELGVWDGATPLDISADAGRDLPVVVIVQSENHGAIVAAGQID